MSFEGVFERVLFNVFHYRQLLLDCGIGTGAEDVSVNQHRALIFCQLKAMLDIVEHDLLRRHLPAVSYLRLDGSVPPASRHSIVTKFNSDPSIDVLLLTTQVRTHATYPTQIGIILNDCA